MNLSPQYHQFTALNDLPNDAEGTIHYYAASFLIIQFWLVFVRVLIVGKKKGAVEGDND